MWRVCGGVDVELMALWCDVVARIGLFDDSADLIEYGFFEPVLICAAWAGGHRILESAGVRRAVRTSVCIETVSV